MLIYLTCLFIYPPDLSFLNSPLSFFKVLLNLLQLHVLALLRPVATLSLAVHHTGTEGELSVQHHRSSSGRSDVLGRQRFIELLPHIVSTIIIMSCDVTCDDNKSEYFEQGLQRFRYMNKGICIIFLC